MGNGSGQCCCEMVLSERDGVSAPGQSIFEATHAGVGEAAEGKVDVKVAATELLRLGGASAYHTSVMLGDREYFFDSTGIVSAPAYWSHDAARRRLRREAEADVEVVHIGFSAITGNELTKHLMPFFKSGTYDIVTKNCNTFSDVAVYFLSKMRLDARFCRLENVIKATKPFSVGLVNTFLWGLTAAHELSLPPRTTQPRLRRRSSQAHLSQPGRLTTEYRENPLAAEFDVEDVIASCDDLVGSDPDNMERA